MKTAKVKDMMMMCQLNNLVVVSKGWGGGKSDDLIGMSNPPR